MNTDAESLTQGILLTADVSYLKAVMEVRGEIVAAGYTPSAEVPTTDDLDIASEVVPALTTLRVPRSDRPDSSATRPIDGQTRYIHSAKTALASTPRRSRRRDQKARTS